MNGHTLSVRGYRPAFLAETIFALGAARRLRHPAVQEEIELRVDIYAEQVKRYGRIRRWLPRRGKGKSVRAMRADEVVRASANGSFPAGACVLPKAEHIPS